MRSHISSLPPMLAAAVHDENFRQLRIQAWHARGVLGQP